MSLADNGNKQACGKCINVHYGGKSVKVQVRDKLLGSEIVGEWIG
jgi:ribosomal protein S19